MLNFYCTVPPTLTFTWGRPLTLTSLNVRISMKLLRKGSVHFLPINRLIPQTVFSGLSASCRSASSPISRSPFSRKATQDGVRTFPYSLGISFLVSFTKIPILQVIILSSHLKIILCHSSLQKI